MTIHRVSSYRRLGFWISITLTIALAACKTPSGATAQALGSVTGRVYDGKTSQPLGNVLVSIGPLIIAHTSPDGSFLLTRVPVGKQFVRVTPPGGFAPPSPAPVEIIENHTTAMEPIPLAHVR